MAYQGKSETMTCTRCQKHHLHWEKVRGKWKLYHGDTPHKCKIPLPLEVKEKIAASRAAYQGHRELDREFRDRIA